jgi:hypothetical protein
MSLLLLLATSYVTSPVTSNLCAIGNVLFVQYAYLNPVMYRETNDTYEVDQEFVKFYEKLEMETKVSMCSIVI